MSAYTTLRFTRGNALEYIKKKLEEPHCPDKTIEQIMDVLLEPQLYNCIISDFPDSSDEYNPHN